MSARCEVLNIKGKNMNAGSRKMDAGGLQDESDAKM